MALYLFSDVPRPTRLLNQHFGMGLDEDDFSTPLPLNQLRHFHAPGLRPDYYRPWRIATQDTGSTVKCDKDHFQVNLDVQQFSPEELTVKVVDNFVIIEGKHEEKQDEHGFVSRQFTRRYTIPKDHDNKNVVSKLSSDGVLSISVPRHGAIQGNERSIPITHTGEPHKPVKSPQPQLKEAGDN